MNRQGQTRIAVDIGGTFTDIALDDGSALYTAKTLTTPDNPVRGVVDVIEIACKNANCEKQSIRSVIHGTTLATNALIERKGAKVGLITTEGFRDIIEIAYERLREIDPELAERAARRQGQDCLDHGRVQPVRLVDDRGRQRGDVDGRLGERFEAALE